MNDAVNFRDLGLDERLLQALTDVGYETPSPIQQACIPPLLQGRDLLGEAQTGTGKTAAFALPLLQRLDLTVLAPQVLVLTPTRELAIQVAEAFQRYAKHLGGLHVLPVYGGQGMDQQLRQLRRGVHVIVGTPGRVMDHLERGTLKLDGLRALVLDEADEMLRMGFIDAVEWILEHTPPERQTALFSATMLPGIEELARTHDAFVTVEEHAVPGGAGSACLEAMAALGLTRPVLQLGLPDKFIDHGDPALLLRLEGLDAAGIERSVRARFAELLGAEGSPRLVASR